MTEDKKRERETLESAWKKRRKWEKKPLWLPALKRHVLESWLMLLANAAAMRQQQACFSTWNSPARSLNIFKLFKLLFALSTIMMLTTLEPRHRLVPAKPLLNSYASKLWNWKNLIYILSYLTYQFHHVKISSPVSWLNKLYISIPSMWMVAHTIFLLIRSHVGVCVPTSRHSERGNLNKKLL